MSRPEQIQPLVSVIVPAFNAEATLAASVTSLLEQDYPRVEVVVVDDCSSDATPDVATSFGADIVFHRLAQNGGRGAARNAAVSLATGGLLALQDADDVARSGRLSATVPTMVEDTDAVLVSGQAVCVDRRLGTWILRHYPTDRVEIRDELAAGRMAVCHGASLIRRSAFEQVGGYRTDLVRAQDFDLVRRLSSVGALRAVDDVLIDYRHDVVLPYSYWESSRRFALAAARGTAPEGSLPLRDRVRYPAAMCRRAGRYLTTRAAA